MGDVINLRQIRKKKARAEREEKAAENRHRFGRTRADAEKEAIERDRAERLIEGHKRDGDDA